MLFKPHNSLSMGRAEVKFRAAFERLKANEPELLPKGTQVSQNNVAREAGVDPSALKKTRFPALVAEIQYWINEYAEPTSPSTRQTLITQRNRNRELRERIKVLEAQRDGALGLLAEAETLILELSRQNSGQQVTPPLPKIAPIRGKQPQR